MSTVMNHQSALTYDQWMLALCLWREARGQSIEAKRAIACVICNRVSDKRWPDTLPGVILQPWQFSSFNAGDPNAVKFPSPAHPVEWKAFEECVRVACEPAADVVGGADHYHSLPEKLWPSWHDPKKVTAHIGPFWFLKL